MAFITSDLVDDPMAVASSSTPPRAARIPPSGPSEEEHQSKAKSESSETGKEPLNEPDNSRGTQSAAPPAVAVSQSDASIDPAKIFFSEYPPPPEPTTEFDRKYPSDRFGDEVTDNARVWKVYRDEAMTEDRSMLDGWNKTLDILLIFAGLFSSVSTAFIIESYKLLQPDYTQYIVQALFTLSTENGLDAFNFARVKLTPPSVFNADPSLRWVNGLWFVSLGLSLAVALLCILAKQWLEEYHARISAASRSPRHWSRRHVQYKEALLQWHVPAFISVLPAVLHASLFLFFAGLYVFLGELDGAIATALLCIAAPLLAFYVISILIPMRFDHCPWSTTLVGLLLRFAQSKKRLFVSFSVLASKPLGGLATSSFYNFLRTSLVDPRSKSPRTTETPNAVGGTTPALPLSSIDGKALEWLITTAPSSDVVSVAVQAIGSLHPFGDTVSYLSCSAAAQIAITVAAGASTFPWCSESYDIAHARMKRVALCITHVEYHSQWSFITKLPNHYDNSALAAIRVLPVAPGLVWHVRRHGIPPVDEGFDIRQPASFSTRFVEEIESCMEHAAGCANQSSGYPPFLPSTALLLLLHIPSVPLLVFAVHTYLYTWTKDPLSMQLVVQSARRSLRTHQIMPSNTAECPGCCFSVLEIWCQILSHAETWSFGEDGINILQDDIRWFARVKEWDQYACPAGFKHSLAHFSCALDVCASRRHPLRSLPISVLNTAFETLDQPRSASLGPELWYPSAARSLNKIIQGLWYYHRGTGFLEELNDMIRSNPLFWLINGVCHSGITDGPISSRSQHPHCVWEVMNPVPCSWDYSAAWNDPTCFLRHWDDEPSAWHMLHEIEPHLQDVTVRDLLALGDILAAQLCVMHRCGHDISDARSEFFVVDSCFEYINRLCLYACTYYPDGEDSSPLSYGLDEALGERTRLLRFVRHCIELRGPDWWNAGFSAFYSSPEGIIVNGIVNSGREYLRPQEEIVEIVRNYRAFIAELDSEVQRLNRCTECPKPLNEGPPQASSAPRDIESQCLGFTFRRQ